MKCCATCVYGNSTGNVACESCIGSNYVADKVDNNKEEK